MGGHYSFPWVAPLSLDPYLILQSVKQEDIKYHFLSLCYDLTWDWTLVSGTIGKLFNHYVDLIKDKDIFDYIL